MDSLLKLMNAVYLPSFLTNTTWPETVKREFSGQLHKFMASLTETTNQAKGWGAFNLTLTESANIAACECSVGWMFAFLFRGFDVLFCRPHCTLLAR